MEELEQKLDEAIRYLTTDGCIKQQDLDNLLGKRLPEFTVSDVQKRYPELRIISSTLETPPLNPEPTPPNSPEGGQSERKPAAKQPAQSQTLMPDLLRGELRQHLVLKDVVKAKILLAKLEASAEQIPDIAELRQEVETLIRETEAVQVAIGRLESAGKYYELREKINQLEVAFVNYPSLADIKQRALAKIKVAEAYLESARNKKAGKDKVEYYLRALEECKDCHEAIAALSLLPPDPPNSLHVELQPNCISLHWTSSSSGRGVVYRLLKKWGPPPLHATDGTILAETTALYFEDLDTVPGENYSYAVYALRGGIASNTAAIAGSFLFTSEIKEPNASIGNQEVCLRWQLPPNAKGVEIFRSLNDAPSNRIIGEAFARLGPVEEYIDQDVHNDLTYGYLICIIFNDIAGREHYTSGVKLTATPLSPPVPITTLEAELEGEQVNLQWEPTPDSSTVIIASAQPLGLAPEQVIEKALISELGEAILVPSGSKRTSWAPQRIGHHYFTALSVANNLAVIGNSISINYVPPLSTPQTAIRGHELFLEWRWPEHSKWARIEYCNDLHAFENSNYQEMIIQNISRKDYDFHQGFLLRNVERKLYYFRLFNLPHPDAEPAAWSTPVTVEVDNTKEIDIKYHIKIIRNLFRKPKAAFLHISCTDFEKVPELELLFATGGIPRLKTHGKFIMKIGRYEMSGPEVRIEIPPEFLGQKRYAKLFFESTNIGNLRLRPPRLENLQLF